jgi:hypothetical protein
MTFFFFKLIKREVHFPHADVISEQLPGKPIYAALHHNIKKKKKKKKNEKLLGNSAFFSGERMTKAVAFSLYLFNHACMFGKITFYKD